MTQPTQTRHPWRAVYRTIVAVVPAAAALLYLLPDMARQAGIAQVGWVAGALTVTAAITRVLAMPTVNDWLHAHLPDLAAQPKPADSAPPPAVAHTLPAPGSIVWTTPGDTYGDTLNAPTS